jgi:hypothetical protein
LCANCHVIKTYGKAALTSPAQATGNASNLTRAGREGESPNLFCCRSLDNFGPKNFRKVGGSRDVAGTRHPVWRRVAPYVTLHRPELALKTSNLYTRPDTHVTSLTPPGCY